MSMKNYFTKYKTELLFHFGLLTILGIAFFLQTIYSDSVWNNNQENLKPHFIFTTFVDRVVAAYLWLMLTPAIIWTSEKIAKQKFPFMGMAVSHFAVGLSFTFFHIPIYSSFVFITHAITPWMYAIDFEKIHTIDYSSYIVYSLTRVNHVYRFLYYSIIVAVHFAFDYFRKYSERELQASQLENQLKETQLRTLHQQLQPHFLFNTLNSISALMYKSVDEADKMLTYLGDLLRISLERMSVQEVPLKDDIAFIERYLLIEKIRMGDRLIVKTNFHPDTLDALVPCMLAQPILENAIKHGISPNAKQGTIFASTWRHAEKLFFQIEDTGNGMSGSLDDNIGKGFGLKNTVDRLTLLYRTNYTLEFSNRDGGGLRVTLSIPFRMSIN